MHELIKLEKKIVPELVELIEKRYSILRNIYYNEPIGRRILANKLGIGERIVRTEINFLKNENLIEVNTPGMSVTEEGKQVLEKLKDFIYQIKGLDDIEETLKKQLQLGKVIIVPGDVEEENIIINELGKAAANFIKDNIEHNNIISLTGGTTVKSVIDNMPKINKINNLTVLPARGGMGRNVSIQSNTLVSRLAEKINANYRLLHVPDDLSDVALNAVLNEKSVKDITDKIQSSDMLIFGIGKAEEMALKRGMNEKEIQDLLLKGAEAEAFGYYFSQKGEAVHCNPTIGIKIEDLEKIKFGVAVAAGKSKARAILAAEMNLHSKVLVTDEGAAREILKLIQQDL
ncbi:sugar-binding transcriptional regulator [Haloimpatiens sp. FM7315]|uniref:sugar-binding transcriptional regulator n=1 Tax=Haloimpatiens sp. FM7315 TaxID=3298609 RepID=UPI00370A71F2